MLDAIFGSDVMEEYRKARPAGYVDLMNAFESRKRGCAPKKLTPMNIALPFSFIDFYHRMKKNDVSHVADRIAGPSFEPLTSFKLRISRLISRHNQN